MILSMQRHTLYVPYHLSKRTEVIRLQHWQLIVDNDAYIVARSAFPIKINVAVPDSEPYPTQWTLLHAVIYGDVKFFLIRQQLVRCGVSRPVSSGIVHSEAETRDAELLPIIRESHQPGRLSGTIEILFHEGQIAGVRAEWTTNRGLARCRRKSGRHNGILIAQRRPAPGHTRMK